MSDEQLVIEAKPESSVSLPVLPLKNSVLLSSPVHAPFGGPAGLDGRG